MYLLNPKKAIHVCLKDQPRHVQTNSITGRSKTRLSRVEVHQILRRATSLTGESIQYLDEGYYCAPARDYEHVARLTRRDQLALAPSQVTTNAIRGPDCDDFAWVLRSAFVMDAYRNGVRRTPYCFGLIVASKWRLRDDTVVDGSHALNWFIADNKKLWFMDTTDDGYIYWQAPSNQDNGPLLDFSWAVV